MEVLDLRHFRSADLQALLEEEKAVWQRELQWDYSASASLILRYLDMAVLPGYVALEGGRPVGLSFYVYENNKGVVGDVFVSNFPGTQATELALLSHVVETLRATPGIRRIEAQLMILRHQPPAEFFTERNLQGFQRQFMVLQLDEAAPPQLGAAADFRIEPWDARKLSEAAQLIGRAYRGHIDSSISDQYQSQAGAIRFLDNIIHYPGCGDFDPDCSFFAVGTDSGKLAGMALSSLVGPRVHHITQLCVDPEVRRAGVGRNLIEHIVQKLRERGAATASLTVTTANLEAIRLYERLHFSTLKEFYAFAWETGNGRR